MSSILKSIKLLSDPMRIRLLLVLHLESLSVAELQEIFSMGQSSISTQLSQLKAGGLVADVRSGKSNIYSSIAPHEWIYLAQQAAFEIPETEEDQRAVRLIQAKRKGATRAHFDSLAGKLGKNYVPGHSWKALAEAFLKILNYDHVADLGAGEGTLAQLLAQRAKSVIAIDISPKMVEYGKQLSRKQGLNHLEYRLGDIENPPIADVSIDLAVLSQALHHAESPQRALDAAFRLLKPGGKLIVLDLNQHQFEQARELYSDRWLGFSESLLLEMMEKSGFMKIETLIADRELEEPKLQTLLALGEKPLQSGSASN